MNSLIQICSSSRLEYDITLPHLVPLISILALRKHIVELACSENIVDGTVFYYIREQ